MKSHIVISVKNGYAVILDNENGRKVTLNKNESLGLKSGDAGYLDFAPRNNQNRWFVFVRL